ncbi:unnamed protein product [Protopolystoma xenopodis]|uniref:Uncharacterized protein n=1 Tax=Protopolystoma xenopodis TaxID=117903 RepID=A0A448X9I9_9PLAT|nr:unnamed protein product [Protopolystoma xenopodis]
MAKCRVYSSNFAFTTQFVNLVAEALFACFLRIPSACVFDTNSNACATGLTGKSVHMERTSKRSSCSPTCPFIGPTE